MSSLLTSLRESASREDLLTWIEGAIARHDARVTELLEANNREVGRRRAAERCRRLLQEAADRGLIYWEPITAKGHIAKADMVTRIGAALGASEGGDANPCAPCTSSGPEAPDVEAGAMAICEADRPGVAWASLHKTTKSKYRRLAAACLGAPTRQDRAAAPPPTAEQPLKIEVVGDLLVISIGVAALAEAAQFCPQLEQHNEDDGTFSSPSVTDNAAFAKEVAQALEIEAGDFGLTPVQQMLDEAFVTAVESGAEGIEL